jgi:hypothetical protein
MKLKDQDDLAKLAFGLATSARLSKQEQIEAVASIYDVSEAVAWGLIVRGKHLAKMGGERAA